jgi:predicted amidohydrolase
MSPAGTRWATSRGLGQTDNMSRTLRVAGGQLGPIQRDHTRADVVDRLITLLRQAAEHDCELIVYPELALTTFFPRWYAPDVSEFDHWYERSMPNEATAPLYTEAKRLGVGFALGYALMEERHGQSHRWNVMTLVDGDGSEVATFKKVHIPGHDDHDPTRPFQHAERYYFEESPDGFGVWDAFGARVGMMICNDRRWPESYREMALQGVELILCGYNTPIHYAPDPSQDELAGFHNRLVMQAGAYQNGTFVVGVAKGGVEEGVPALAESAIIAPSGEILAQATTDDDELIWADLRLDWCRQYTGTLFSMDYYRRPEAYTRLTAMRGPSG